MLNRELPDLPDRELLRLDNFEHDPLRVEDVMIDPDTGYPYYMPTNPYDIRRLITTIHRRQHDVDQQRRTQIYLYPEVIREVELRTDLNGEELYINPDDYEIVYVDTNAALAEEDNGRQQNAGQPNENEDENPEEESGDEKDADEETVAFDSENYELVNMN